MFMKSTRVLESSVSLEFFCFAPAPMGTEETLLLCDEFLQYPKVILKISIVFSSEK